ncbi:Zinc finger BED domain-containing protein 1 [Merluccius polli]|uniref:Zinc finger BED domain-containing protein 1 n=1 Tax=Merluccius polli TaxID=89951 RepID=A0AA47NV30_MERPO|nr:Zinc finger BED domain-containing protein 1 [Merluccius polli]
MMRKVVSFFHQSTTAAHVLKTKQEMLKLAVHKLIHDGPTRWNTVYDMMERYVEQQAAIYSAITDKDVKKNVKDIAILTDSEAKLADDLIKIIKPLKKVTTIMSTETSPSVSTIIPLQKMIIKSMTQVMRTVPPSDMLGQPSPKTCKTDTEPLIFRTIFTEPGSKVQVPALSGGSVSVNPVKPRWPVHPQQQSQEHRIHHLPRKKSAMAELFGEFFTTEETTTKPPLAWWKSNEHKYPHIAKLAQHYHTVW